MVILLHTTFTLVGLMVVMTQLYYHVLNVMPNVQSFRLVTLLFGVAMVQLIKAEVNGFAIGAALLLFLLTNFFPRIVNRGRFLPRRLSESPGERPPVGWSSGRIASVSTGLVVALIALSALPNFTNSTNFSRNRVVSLAVDPITQKINEHPPGYVAPTAADIPDKTHLVATPSTKKYNVVQIVLESERYKSTTLSNPALDTTPSLVEMKKNSLDVQHAYTVMPHTTLSLVTSNCGVAPPLDTTGTESKPGGVAAKCLPSLLDEQGYNTAFFQSATKAFENRGAVVKNFGYQHFYPWQSFSTKGFSPVNTLGYEDDIMLKPSLDWATEHKDKPFMMEYMTVTAHTKYVMPKGYKLEHYSDDTKLNNYMNGVRYQDRFVGKVIDGFKKAGLYDNTIFVVMADHGEGFFEHGRRLHSDTIWNEGLRVPMLIHAPDRWQNGAVLKTPVQNMSMLQTITDLLGYKITGGTYHASSILSPQDNKNPLVSSCWDLFQCMAYFPDKTHKYIYFFGYKPDEYFDLSKDPEEEHNLINTLSSKTQEKYRNLVLAWQAQVNATHALSKRLAHK